ncbi:S1-C subfamily serine protease [Haloferula luteola]|uniref:S1-C subfamily serine protease n=1 Tax=Haloferula luteola TaxID=595692 RepID=A0A840V5I9_9BACT|nr:trypsin-like peptidase domain-containing protein [Haloferula luteola]MBB5353507.1 S1-C subfamily serine protease [Haloferula luteola]
MNRGTRSFLVLAAVFLGTFASVFLIRNGTGGLQQLLGREPSHEAYRPETYTLPDTAPLELDDVELLTRLNDEYARLTDAVVKSVVSIDTSGVRAERLLDGFGRQLIRPVPTQGQGSGVIVTHEGHIVTNHHVIKDQQKIEVTLHNGEKYNATLVGDDPLLDIAVLKIEGGGEFEPLKLGDSAKVRRGQIVFAIGNPFGLGETVTQGIISAVERSVSDTQRDLFQTDAAINPGNSGGPLVNLRGEVIGINSAIYRPDERVNSGFQGVGFSIPSNEVMTALQTILERGRPIRGYLGVRMSNLDRQLRRQLGYTETGAMVETVGAGSPAETAGLQPYDIVRQYDGKKVENVTALLNMVQRSKVGSTLPVEIWRKGEVQTLQVTIAEAGVRSVAAPERDVAGVLDQVGVTLGDEDPSLPGLPVTEVVKGSLAEGHLQAGDRIFGINGVAVRSKDDLLVQLAASVTAQSTALQIVRGNVSGRVTLPPLAQQR